jgi:uncharacterized membrane protein (DUF2068 family)
VERSERLVVAIGAFKLVKAALLGLVGVTALVEVPDQLAATAERVLRWTGGYAARETLERAIGALSSMEPSRVHGLALLSLAYAVTFGVEGVGLVGRKRWAEWLTVFVTASFVPLELVELARHVTAPRIAALVVNLAIVAYLAARRIRARRGGEAGARVAVAVRSRPGPASAARPS